MVEYPSVRLQTAGRLVGHMHAARSMGDTRDLLRHPLEICHLVVLIQITPT